MTATCCNTRPCHAVFTHSRRQLMDGRSPCTASIIRGQVIENERYSRRSSSQNKSPYDCVHSSWTQMALRLGVDVGGTNTDAALLSPSSEVLATAKSTTTPDIVTGIENSIRCLQDHVPNLQGLSAIMIGTTQFVNAVIQQRGLSRVLVVRLCGTATAALPPWVNIPQTLAHNISAGYLMAQGGYEFDGKEISALSPADVSTAADLIIERGAAAVVVCGVHAPVNPAQELDFAAKLTEELKQRDPGRPTYITLSQKLSGRLGLLEREAAAILNASLQPLAAAVIPSYSRALQQLGLQHVPLYLTGNDGTLMTAATAQEYPVLTSRSGPVNSVRGAAHLAGLRDALVIDIGGTTTDVGMVLQGMPRMCGAFVNICGVLTNFRMPDVTSFGLGGGSLVTWQPGGSAPGAQQEQQQQCTVGPLSVGDAVVEKCLVCGGDTLTASDVAVLLHDRLPDLRSKQQAVEQGTLDKTPDADLMRSAWEIMQHKLAAAVDAAKTCTHPVPLIVVGGGAGLCGDSLSGVSQIIRPDHAAVANAVGAAIPQVAGTVDTLLQLTGSTRQQQLAAAVEQATAAAVAAGADRGTCEVVEQEEVPVAYGAAGSTHVHIKVVGQLNLQEAPTRTAAEQLEAAAAPPPDKLNVCSTSVAEGVVQQSAAMIAAGQTAAAAAAAAAAAGTAEDLSSAGAAALCSGSSQLFGSYTLDHLQQHQPNISSQGLWEVCTLDLDAMAIGAQVLGAGGGGSASHNRLKPLHAMHSAAASSTGGGSSSSMQRRCPVVLSLTDLPDDAYVCDVGGMGAPTVSAEKLDSFECSAAVQGLSAVLPRPITALLCAEVGGGNALEPLAVGLERGLPVVDADLMGRAFPELQMSTAAIAGVSPTPAVACDDKGNTLVMTAAASPDWAERVIRAACTEMGCSVGLAATPMTGKTAKQVVVPGSLSLAWRLGMSVMTAHAAKADPVAAILQLYQGTGRLLCSGKVTDVVRHTAGGFVRGSVRISSRGREEPVGASLPPSGSAANSSRVQPSAGDDIKVTAAGAKVDAVKTDADGDLLIEFQNENLVAIDSAGRVLACVPDLICILETSSGLAVASEEVRYGLWVTVVGLPAHPLLRTAAALEIVGPAAFGYPRDQISYAPVGGFPVILTVHDIISRQVPHHGPNQLLVQYHTGCVTEGPSWDR